MVQHNDLPPTVVADKIIKIEDGGVQVMQFTAFEPHLNSFSIM